VWFVSQDENGRRRPRPRLLFPLLVVAALLALLAGLALRGAENSSAASPSGAIFTTTPEGSIVNENVHYDDKRDVYLDGGPPPNAPKTAAGLDDGYYVFQVTEPAGKFLLSEDPARCRVVRVGGGVIVQLVPPTAVPGLGVTTNNWADSGPDANKPCHIADNPPHPTNPGVRGNSGRHDTNVDSDHGPPAIVVQLMPYGTTPNPGNVYKAWMIPLNGYRDNSGNLNKVPAKLPNGLQKPQRCPDFCAAADPGFGPARDQVKTDNFKVKAAPVPPPVLHVRKCEDRNGNGAMDPIDPLIPGWRMDITDPTSVTQAYYTPVDIVAEPQGDYVIDEENPSGWVHTITIVDGTPIGAVDPVRIAVGTEDRTVIFCNFHPAKLTACKFYDFDRNRRQSGPLEVDLSGWPMTLTGTTFEGAPVGPLTQRTGTDGCTRFTRLVEGEYTVTEGTPIETSWSHTTPSSVNVSVDPSESETARFGNVCLVPFPGGLTMGYWKTHTGLDSPDRDPTYDVLNGAGFIFLGIPPDNGYPEQQVDDEAGAKTVFVAAEASTHDGVLMLKAQLLAAKLNALKFPGFDLAQFPDGTIVGDVIDEADQILDDLANGISHSKSEIIAAKDLLDSANNNGHTGILVIPSSTPCQYTFP